MLRRAPEYRYEEWYPGRPGSFPTRTAMQVEPPHRFGRKLAYLGTRGGPGSEFTVFYYADPLTDPAPRLIHLVFFDKLDHAASARRQFLARVARYYPSGLAQSRRSLEISRNAIIAWNHPRTPGPERLRSLLRSCLRTR